MTKENNENNFISHLVELRKRLIHSLIFLFIFFLVCYYFSDFIYGFLVDPYAQAVKNDDIERRLIFTALQETFLTYLKVSFFAAFFITSPYVLIQIWKFIAPGLYEHEKKSIMPYLDKSLFQGIYGLLNPSPKSSNLYILDHHRQNQSSLNMLGNHYS